MTNTTCTWWVEVANPLLSDPDALDAGWFPESKEEMTVIVECGAPAVEDAEGRFRCEAGHSRGTLEEELGGLEWRREMEDRRAW